MDHDNMWRLAYSGMHTDDKHTGLWKKWHGPISPNSCAYQACVQGCEKK